MEGVDPAVVAYLVAVEARAAAAEAKNDEIMHDIQPRPRKKTVRKQLWQQQGGATGATATALLEEKANAERDKAAEGARKAEERAARKAAETEARAELAEKTLLALRSGALKPETLKVEPMLALLLRRGVTVKAPHPKADVQALMKEHWNEIFAPGFAAAAAPPAQEPAASPPRLAPPAPAAARASPQSAGSSPSPQPEPKRARRGHKPWSP